MSRRAHELTQHLHAGDYLARYEDTDEKEDPGSRCGFKDPELDDIRKVLAERNLRLVADDVGLRIVERDRDPSHWY